MLVSGTNVLKTQTVTLPHVSVGLLLQMQIMHNSVTFYRAMLCIVYTMLLHDVCLSHASILLKLLNISNVFHFRVATSFSFFHTKWYRNPLAETPTNWGVECKGVWNKKFSYHKQITHQLHSQYVDGMYSNSVTLKSGLEVTLGHSYKHSIVWHCLVSFARYWSKTAKFSYSTCI